MKLRACLPLSIALVLAAHEPAHTQINVPNLITRSEAVSACAELGGLEFPDVLELRAEWRQPGPFETRSFGRTESVDLPAFCRVTGVVAPAIGFEVWLPAAEGWNGRFLGVGGGGYTGTISHSAMAPAIRDGYVTASTDTGHGSGALDWLGDRGLLRDYGYRGIYEMTEKAEAIVRAFYGRPASYRYFNGCSTGGRQGLMEAQRYPDHYDGIVAGDPVSAFINTRATLLWATRAAQPAPGTALLSRDTLAHVTGAVLAQCDALDGVTDGVLENPQQCSFDPSQLQCDAGSTDDACLSPDQVVALRQIYAGPSDARTGLDLPGFAIGGETGWSFANGGDLSTLALDFFRTAVFADPDWDWRSFDFADDYALAHSETGWIMNATAANLTRFRDNGGKLIIYHGWNDSGVSPEASIAYYESVAATLTDRANPRGIATDDFARLFLVPGMGHCGGGTGTADFDAQRAIEDWVERGVAPDRIEAARIENGETQRTRPLCPYPQTARYSGSGDTDRAESFVCAE